MKAKIIFIIILALALVGIGTIVYRSYYKGGSTYPSYATQTQEQAPMPAAPARPGELMTTPAAPPSVTPPSSPPPVTSQAVTSGIITYDGSGFSPKPITVKAGATVVFKNESSSDMWPASAPHPAHTDYPGFDALKPIKPSESYSFTFMRIGTWKYHNHLNPKQYGSVVVE